MIFILACYSVEYNFIPLAVKALLGITITQLISSCLYLVFMQHIYTRLFSFYNVACDDLRRSDRHVICEGCVYFISSV